MYVLRNKKDHRPLNLAFSIEGLQFTTDSSGNYIYFKKARAVIRNGKLEFSGDLRISDHVYVEVYDNKRRHKEPALNRIEMFFANKAKKYGKPTQTRRTS